MYMALADIRKVAELRADASVYGLRSLLKAIETGQCSVYNDVQFGDNSIRIFVSPQIFSSVELQDITMDLQRLHKRLTLGSDSITITW